MSPNYLGVNTSLPPTGSHHCQVAMLVPDDKLDCFAYSEKKLAWTKTIKLFYLGPVLLPRLTDFRSPWCVKKTSLIFLWVGGGTSQGFFIRCV